MTLPSCFQPVPQPPRRRLTIYVGDPMVQRGYDRHLTLDIPNEPLARGPVGARLAVIDYDAANRCYYEPIDLNDSALLMQDGLLPNEVTDPRFHQQMVYAVGMKVLESFDQALGRRIRFRRGLPLRIFPHAFHGENAFYDRRALALFFGYFRADRKAPGRNLPGQHVFTCLSHDIITHEMTHALLDRLKRYFILPLHPDCIAFHEGIADIVAILQQFSLPMVLGKILAEHHGNLRGHNALLDLAEQFGYATGGGRALRTALSAPDPRAYAKATEPHRRGALLVSAVLAALCTLYERRTHDLLRIATGGTGTLPQGELSPDLVQRLSLEAADTAHILLTMCLRALDFTAPHSITFGDFLRALITADYELYPNDELGARSALIEAFRERGIYATDTGSLSEEALRLDQCSDIEDTADTKDQLVAPIREGLFRESQTLHSERWPSPDKVIADFQRRVQELDKEIRPTVLASLAAQDDPAQDGAKTESLRKFALEHAERLGLDPSLPIQVIGFHPSFRTTQHGELKVDVVVQYLQKKEVADPEAGGMPLFGGTTVIATTSGRVRFVLKKPLPSAVRRGRRAYEEELLHARRLCVEALDADDPLLPWAGPEYYASRLLLRRSSFALTRRYSY
ncbi:MAG: hypothetical protein U1A78_25515 [Polyangia bacterium]